MVIVILYFAGLASGIAACWIGGVPLTTLTGSAPTLFRYFMLVGVGLSLVIAFFGHVFVSDMAAKRIGWPTGNPFQKEVGFWDGAVGVAAMLCSVRGPQFWSAVVVINTFFWLMAGLLHASHIFRDRNFKVDNVLPAVADIVYAATIVFLYVEAVGANSV